MVLHLPRHETEVWDNLEMVYRLLKKIIIHSKYFPYSDWLKAHV